LKKLFVTIIALIVLSMAALPAAAQTRGRCASRSTYNSRYDSRYDRNVSPNRNGVTYNDDIRYENYRYQDNRSFWEKHRDKITTAGGAVGGALLGGVIGGKKGAVIGAVTGGAGAAIYTYKIRDKNRRY
jgi:hypothetical protein